MFISVYKYIFVYIGFLGGYHIRTLCDTLKEIINRCKNLARKTLTQEKFWTFKKILMGLIFKFPYHNHFFMDFNFFLSTCMLKK